MFNTFAIAITGLSSYALASATDEKAQVPVMDKVKSFVSKPLLNMAIVLGLVLLITVAAYYAMAPFKTVDEQDELLEEKEADQAGINKWMAVFGVLALVITAGGIGLRLMTRTKEYAPFNLIIHDKNGFQIIGFETLKDMRDDINPDKPDKPDKPDNKLLAYVDSCIYKNGLHFYYAVKEQRPSNPLYQMTEDTVPVTGVCTDAMIHLLYLKKEASDILQSTNIKGLGLFMPVADESGSNFDLLTENGDHVYIKCPPGATWGQL